MDNAQRHVSWTRSVYFQQDVVKFKINNTGEYTGIGALITRRDDKIIIREIYKDFPLIRLV
jgi:carboxyl-terminal processing protease